MRKVFNKFAIFSTIMFFSIVVAVFSLCFASAQQNQSEFSDTAFSATGTIYENATTNALAGVKVDAFTGPYDIKTPKPFDTTTTDQFGHFTIKKIQPGITMTLQFSYNSTDPQSTIYAGNRIYVDTPITSDINLDTYKPTLDLTLHKYTKNVSGYVKDQDTGQGIPNITIEFYNPCGLNSPAADCAITTDANGYYNLASTQSYLGVAANAKYYLVASYNGATPWDNEAYDNYTSQTIENLLFFLDKPSVVDFSLAKLTTIQLFDRNQSEETFFEQFKHKVYINGQLSGEGLLGDSYLSVKGYFELKVIQDCTLQLKYIANGDEMIETFEPLRYKSEKGWIPVYPLNNFKAVYWQLWEGFEQNDIHCFQNFEYAWKQKTGYLSLDVHFEEASPLNLTFNPNLHSYFHVIQKYGDETYTYDYTEPFQNNFFDASKIYVDENNNLNIESNVADSNQIQHTIIQEIPVVGAEFINWKINDQDFFSISEPVTTQQNIPVNIEVNEKLISNNNDTAVPQTGDNNKLLVIVLIVVLGLAVLGLIIYFIVKKLRNKKIKNRKH